MAVLTFGAAAGWAGPAPANPAPTEVLRWSPLDSTGTVKKTLRVEPARVGACSDIGYTYVGGIAYRCGAGHGLYNACWREGPNPTEFVLCAGTPWTTTVTRLRSPHLLLYPGVTYAAASDHPWGIELANGQRCRVGQGAHDVVRRGNRTFVVDYRCDGDLVLLRNLRRGRVWRIGAARYVNLARRYKLIGDRTIRRAILGELPPVMQHQHELARRAVIAARRVLRSSARPDSFALTWVRLTLPDAEWAHVIFSSTSGRGLFAVLHRADGRWMDASTFKPYCIRLAPDIRRQLFLDHRTWNPPPDWLLAPAGEQRC